MKISVLDKGSVELLGILGDDLTVVNAARVSFGKQKSQLDEGDRKLIKYLIKHKHYSPFRQIILQFRMKFPEVVGRQLYKHIVGISVASSYPTVDHGWNEISRRYVQINEFYTPDKWRLQSQDNKQASLVDCQGNLVYLNQQEADICSEKYQYALEVIEETIEDLINRGVAKEQAQILLPISFYTEVYWTASFQAVMNLIALRDAPDSQWEIREYARAIKQIVSEKLPIITEEWLAYEQQ